MTGSNTARPRRARPENQLVTLFRIPLFRRMWAAITFSSFGDWLGLLANTALAQQLTSHQTVATQGVAISGVLLVRLAPDLVFGPFAAALADKFDRRRTVIIGEVTAAVLYASIAIGYNLVWLYVAQFVIEAAGLFTQPAKQVVWISVMPKRLLATGNQISLISVYGSVPVAAAVFALLSAGNRIIGGKSATGPGHVNVAIVIALCLDAVSFIVSASTVFLSRRQISAAPGEREHEQGVVTLLREGVVFVRKDPLIRALYIGIIGAFAAGGLTIGVAQLWVHTLSAGTAGYSIMFGTLFTGLAVGMLIGPRVLPSYPRSRVFGLAIGGAGVTLLIMSLIRDFILADGLAAFVGVFAGMAWIIGYTLIGQEVEDRLRGRIFAFVLSSVRLMLLATIAVGPLLAGFIGSHSIHVGDESHLRFSGPGLTLLLGGVVAIAVSWYATSRAAGRRSRLRDVVGRRLGGVVATSPERRGLFVAVDGMDADATAGYAALVAAAVRDRGYVALETEEPTDLPTGQRVTELLIAAASDGTAGVEPETAALLSAADRAEHVAIVVRPALQRGEVVVCDRFVLTSLALHGSGRGADVDRIRSVNAWSTGGLQPDLVLVVDDGAEIDAADHGVALTGSSDDVDTSAARATLLDEAAMNSDRFVVCLADRSDELPPAVLQRLDRLLGARTALRRTGDPPLAGDDHADTVDHLPPAHASPPTAPQLAAPTESQPR